MKEGKGKLKVQSKARYFILIDGVFKKKKEELKNIPIPFNLEENLDGNHVEVSYQMQGNSIIVKQIRLGDKTFGDMNYKPKRIKTKPQKRSGRGKHNSDEFSKTPYNFVSLNKNILTTSIYRDGEISDGHKQNIYHKNKLTGSIHLTLENETPLFIGSKKVKCKEKDKEGFSEILPFKIQGKPAIPGSSIRGMLYALYEIASYSPMVNMEDLPVYFRSVRDDFNGKKELRFGILSQNQSPRIYDLAEKEDVENISYRGYREYTLVNDNDYIGVSSGKIMGKVHSFGIAKEKLNFKNCGLLNNKSVSRVIKDYRNDSSRDGKVDQKLNIIKKSRREVVEDNYGNTIKGCPIWFTLEGDEVKSIGIAKYHRVPADNRSIDMLPENHRTAFENRNNNNRKYEENPYPFSGTEILFGTSETHSSKLRFTDATPDNDNAEFAQQSLLLKPLLSPKIKSANLYLKSSKGKPNWENSSKNQVLGGFKGYYHKSKEYNDRYDNKKDGSKSLQSFITPINPEGVFKGTIHFKNLSKVELGGLLFVIKLQEGLRHSLGMGKPYGLGQVKLSIDAIKTFDMSNRYSTLANQVTQVNQDKCIKNFERYILNEIGEREKQSLWELNRFKKLTGLLMRREASDDRKSEYMSDYSPFQKRRLIINDPEELSNYKVCNNDFLKK